MLGILVSFSLPLPPPILPYLLEKKRCRSPSPSGASAAGTSTVVVVGYTVSQALPAASNVLPKKGSLKHTMA